MSDTETAAPIDAPPPDEYAIVEVYGHRRLVGRVLEVERFGAKLLRIDIPRGGDFAPASLVTQYYGGSAIFSFTPCTREYVEREHARSPAAPALTHQYDEDEDDTDQERPF